MTIPSFISEHKPLSGLTTFGIGGQARFFSEPSTLDEVADTYGFSERMGLPVLVMGGGSNLLIADAGVEAVVMRPNSRAFGGISFDSNDPLVCRIGAASSLSGVLEQAAEAGMSGLEFMSGIPGKIGGAVVMNAGGAETGIGSRIIMAEGINPQGTPFRFEGEALGFCYRSSSLSRLTVLSLVVQFAGRDDSCSIRDRMKSFRDAKRMSQPVGAASAGCIFTNPPGTSAGLLLDRAGCKGMREGGAVVSTVHANFIVNDASASSADVAKLAVRMRDRVAEMTGTVLHCEIRLWGEAPEFAKLLHCD